MPIAVPLVIVAVGAVLVAFSIFSYRRARQRTTLARAGWSRTDGTIESAKIEERTVGRDDYEQTDYWPKVSYRYSVGGREITGSRLSLAGDTAFANLDEGQKWLLSHAPGTAIPVHYDPAKPHESALDLSDPSKAGLAVGIIGVVVVVGGCVFALIT